MRGGDHNAGYDQPLGMLRVLARADCGIDRGYFPGYYDKGFAAQAPAKAYLDDFHIRCLDRGIRYLYRASQGKSLHNAHSLHRLDVTGA